MAGVKEDEKRSGRRKERVQSSVVGTSIHSAVQRTTKTGSTEGNRHKKIHMEM